MQRKLDTRRAISLSIIVVFSVGAVPGAETIQSGRDTTAKPKTDGRSGSGHWSLQAVKSPTLPQVRNIEWPRNPIDYFIIARLEKAGLSPSPEADRATLIRRLSFDLLGLPPTPREIDAFLADKSPHPFENLVERILASPRYGERWGRHWLDVARYT